MDSLFVFFCDADDFYQAFFTELAAPIAGQLPQKPTAGAFLDHQ